MRSTRIGQNKLKQCMKWTASGLLLAVMFVLVFAGTLSGAFGIEENLQQNGIIENNVASADWNHKAGITIGDTNSNGINATAMATISEVGSHDYYSSTDDDTSLTGKFGIYMSKGSSSDCKKDKNTIALDQGGNTDEANGMVYAVIPLSSEVQNAVNNGRVTLTFSGFFGGGDSNYCNYVIFAYSSSYEVTEGSSYDQSVFKSSILNTETTSASSTEDNSTIATDNAGYCSATIKKPDKWSSPHVTNFSYRSITTNVLPTAKSIIIGLMVHKKGTGFFTRPEMDAFIGKPTITLSCSSASIEIMSGGNGTVSNTALDNTVKSGNTYTFNKIQASATIEATPNVGYHFSKWEKTYDGQTSEWTGATGDYAKSTAKFYSYNILQGEKYTAQFALNQITVVFHRNISSSDSTTNTKTYTYGDTVISLGHWEKTDNKTFVGWAKEDSKDVVYHKYEKNSSGVYDCETSNSDISGKSLINALDHGVTIHLYAVWVDSDFGVLSGKTADSTWGSQNNPFVISGVQHLKNLSDIVNGVRLPVNSVTGEYYGENIVTVATSNNGIVTFANCYFVISADIGSESAPVELTPIGRDATNYFAGTIYGADNSIKTIYLNINQSGESNVGLFGYTNGANISYIKTAGSIVGGESTGGLVGYGSGVTIMNCANNATVSATNQAGGILGATNNATITWSNNSGTISGSSGNVGGILGMSANADNYIQIAHCYNTGNISGGMNVGGIVGRFATTNTNAKNALISECYNTGNISGSSSSDSVGGIVGFAYGGSANVCAVEYCYNKSSVTANMAIGGIVGSTTNGAHVTISYCYADFYDSSKILTANSKKGGIIGGCWNGDNVANINVSNSWAIYSSSSTIYTDCKKHNNLVTSFTVTPIVIDGGETEVDWTNILSQNINGFKISTSVSSGNYLKLSDNNGNGVLPYKVGNGYTEQNSTSSTAITQGDISCDIYYNATTSNDIYAQVEQIGIDTTSKVYIYNANAQQVGGFTLPTGYEALATFYFDRDINGNPTPSTSKTNAGTYVVISDVKIKVGNTIYVVGRAQKNWTITPLYLRVSNATFYYGVDVEKQLQKNIVISETSDGAALTSHPFSVDIDSSAYNFYESISATTGQNTFAIANDKIIVKNGDNVVTDNFVITGFDVVIKEGDFGVANSGIDKNNIDSNKWGSKNNPYIIRNDNQLARLSSIVRSGGEVNSIRSDDLYEYVTATDKTYSGAYFKLAASFTADNFTPIGTNSAVFSGIFDGNGNTITVSVNVAGDYVGLFGYTKGATIQILTVSGSVKGSKYVGGVVGYALNTTIYNVTNNATVTARYSVDNDITHDPNPYNIIKQYDGGNQSGEGFDKVFDGKTSTKFCGTQSGMSFVADLGSSLAVSGFAITNANDTASNTNRRPKTIQIWGSNENINHGNQNGSGNAGASPTSKGYTNWNLVFSLDTNNFSSTSYERVEFAFDGNKTYKYRYYWVYIISAGGIIQFAEFDFLAAGEDEGGVVGYASGSTLKNVANTAQIIGSSNMGGIAGEIANSTSISNATNSGEITSANTAAGIVGKLTSGKIESSKNTGKVTASVSTVVNGNTGAFLGGIAGWADGNIGNCYNTGEITTLTAFGSSNYVGGIAGYLASGKAVSYCYNGGTVAGSSLVGGIVGKRDGSLSYCYQGGKLQSLWDDSGASIGYITGDDGTAIDSCWILPSAQLALHSSITIKVNGYKLEVADSAYVPAKIDGSTYTPYDENGKNWEQILSQNINGFRVKQDVAIGNYFLSTTGSGDKTAYLAPSKVENSDPTNAASRSDESSFTVTAWYGANTQSNIYCATEAIAIENKTTVYNGGEQGFTRTDVNPPLASGKVYGVAFDYYYAKVTPVEEFVYAFDADGNVIANSTNPYQVGEYDTTVFVKIGDIVVGKKCGATYTIDKETINVAWKWTDGKQSDRFDRTAAEFQFIYNRGEQGLSEVTFAYANNTFTEAASEWFATSGDEKYTNASDSAYSRTYTLTDTRNFKIASSQATLPQTTIPFEWIIRKNKLTLYNYWTSENIGTDTAYYTFEYNAAHQGIKKDGGITCTAEPDTAGTSHKFDTDNLPYTITPNPYNDTVNVGTYKRAFTITDTTNYEIGANYSLINALLPQNTIGVEIEAKSVATYSWKIVQYDIANNFEKGKVWFGGKTGDNGLIVGNQLTSSISGTTRGGENVNVNYYPLQSASSGVQQVLVYGQNTTEVQHYLPKNFIIYVQYNDGTIAQLLSNEYELSDLEAPTAANPAPINTSVTASGLGNFTGDLSKYYTVLYSDFGWEDDKNPSSANWGSKDNPYVIDRPEYLLRLSQIVNGGMAWNSIANTAYCYAPQSTATAQNRTYSGTFFLVTADIDMTDYVSTDGLTNFLPIGGEGRPFSATFDGKPATSNGNNYEIKYVYNIGHFVNNDDSSDVRLDYVGLFGYTDGATIQNLIVKSARQYERTSYKGGIHGRDYVGGIVGKAVNSTLNEVKLDYGDHVYGNDYVGGIVGFAQNTTIANANKILNASVQGRFYVGGIAGEWQVYDKSQFGLDNQQRLTPVDSSSVYGVKYVGGLVGWLDLSKCSGSVNLTPQYNNGNDSEGSPKLEVKGTEYVGALFGTLVGNGYHESKTSSGLTSVFIDNTKVGNVTLKPVTYADGDSTYLPKVVGGLFGYIESAALIFSTSWKTSNITFDFNSTSTSFLGGVVGVMGKNSTMGMFVLNKDDGSTLTSVDGAITADTQFGEQGKYNAGSFVGGIVGYVSSQAGTFWNDGTTILGNAVSLENTANIYATGFVGGIFGALGDIALSKIEQSVGAVYNEIAVEKNQDNRKDILQKILNSGVREGLSGSTLGIAPTTDSDYVSGANGKLRNTASVYVSKTNNVGGEYVGGILGYCGANVRLVLKNKPQEGDIDTSALNVYSGGTNVSFMGSYAGGIAGFCDNLEHELQYIVVQAKFIDKNAMRVGGLVGEMMSGKIEGCVVVSAMASGESITYETDNFQGTEYVGGLVGRTENATIKDSIATGFNLQSTSITKGGVLGGGTNPTIEASWTFYIADKGATFSTVSKNTYGKYILVDKDAITSNGSSYPSFIKLCAFAGIADTDTEGAVGVLEFALNVPTQRQLAFYDASGSDKETTNKESFVGFKNENTNLTIKLDMETGTSMQVCLVDVEFVNIPQNDTSNDDTAKKLVEDRYKKPSGGTRYYVEVTEAVFDVDNTRQVTKISANVYFDYKGDGTYLVSVGTATEKTYNGEYKIGDYTADLVPGSEENPFTISNQKEWNDFAYSIYSGANDYDGKFVKLLTDDIVIDNSVHYGTASGTVPLDFSAECTPNSYSDDNTKNAKSNMGYNFAGNISQGGSTVEQIKLGTSTTLSAKTPSFKGVFDGNGHYITINYNSGGYYRVSAFPNAANAVFRNLTIKGSIMAASQMTGADGISGSAAYDIAGFVAKPFGSLEFYNCTNEADIIGLRNVAGIVGYNSGDYSVTLKGCVNTGDITSLEGSYTLGGKGDTYSYDDGWGKAGYSYGTGGILGAYKGTITVESCRNAGKIIGGHNVGGIIGLHDGTSSAAATLTINNCANTGDVLSNSGYWGEDEGGVHGADSRGIRENIFGYAGGLVGRTGQYSTLYMYASYNTGTITTLSNIVGGLVGGVGMLYQPYKTAGRYDPVIKTGGRSIIAYCYNTGAINSGGTYPKTVKDIGAAALTSRENYGGTIAGGFVGIAGNIQVSQGYNAGDITTYCIMGYKFSWQVRAGGIMGQSEPSSSTSVIFDNLYNVGTIYVKTIDYSVGGSSVRKSLRYGAAISGYCDVEGNAGRVKTAECYSINNCVSSICAYLNDENGKEYSYSQYKSGNYRSYTEFCDQWYYANGIAGIGDAKAKYVKTGRVYDTYDALTAAMDENSKLRMTGENFVFNQSTTAFNLDYTKVGDYTSLNEQILSIDSNNNKSMADATISSSDLNEIKWKAFPDSWLYVYGCLPQLSIFALDTQNGLSMRSVGYGKDDYGSYNKDAAPAGSEQYPYIIKDGIDLMGMQALVDAGYSFEGMYIEVADGTNTLDKLASKRIELATYDSTDTAAVNNDSNTMYKAIDQNGEYRVGKSYHLLLKGAIFNKARKYGDITYLGTDYGYWAYNTYYYGGYNDSDYGTMRRYGVFSLQNFIPMGRGTSVFKGNFSGKQTDGENTVIDNVSITTGKDGGGYGGLFAKAQDAYIEYISIGSQSKIWAFSSDNTTEAAAGGIVGLALGSTTIEHCGIVGATQIGAYGKTRTEKISAEVVNAGGIVGLADTKQGSAYNAGITATISNCSVSTTGNIESANSYIGGILGYVGGAEGASGKGNSVRIENCNVQQATIQATSRATTSSYIGGIVGFGSQYVSAFLTGCKVGVDGNVTISGEHSLGGIAGGMSNAQGGYIDSCTVGSKASITRIDQGGDGNVAESANHGTAIGGLVGFTQNSTDTVSPLTTTFSGANTFAGTITVNVEATNKSADSDAAISQIGGIVGDMGSGANFASGSVVIVGGTISVTPNAANVGGVAGRTNTATFIGNFDVKPTMTTSLAENVGGFIGKNIGTVYILADNTDKLGKDGKLNGTQISIGGTIVGTNEVGGFIGVNNSQSTLHIGSNVANAKPYRSGTLNISITATVTGSGENVGGIVGKNEGASASGATDYATIDIVKGVITQNGNIQGKNYVGGIIGRNQGLLTTGGGEADTAVGGATLSEEQINSIKNLSITNNGNVKGGALNGTTYEDGDYVGGVIGLLDSPDTLKATDEGKGAIAGTFTNGGKVEGGRFVGGSIGFVGKNVTITAKDTDTLFVNSGEVAAHGYFAGGSIGALVGTIEGTAKYSVNFENKGNVNATGFVGGSIGVLAGPVKFAQFVNKSNGLTVNAVNAVGGSVGYIGIPTPFETELTKLGITLGDDYIQIVNTHFEAAGNLTVNATDDEISAAKDAAPNTITGWGGVGGAIGVIGEEVAKWGSDEDERNTYYANGNVEASGINNVGGIVGLVLAKDIVISNMLAHKTTVKGGENVGGIVGATKGKGTVIKSAYAVEGTFEGDSNVGGIIGLSESDTDAKTSYWVKGYPNATLAGTDVSNLQEELGKFETIVETVDGQAVVFTEEFCTMYTPKTYYDDYKGTHKYKDTTITAVTDENTTWEKYFKWSLGVTAPTTKNGAWVSPIANAKSYTTGAENTGWYFVYATDTSIGTISAEHSPNANLSYWKRIADAYSASERESGDDTKTLDKSAIVLGGNGQPQKSTLYATATSAGEDSGYYLYMATSGDSRPSATFDNSKFYIETLTAKEGALAKNVAVYYRTISRGKSLTYNGYERYAPVAITASGAAAVPFIETPTDDTTKADSYCYSSDTSSDGTKNEPGTFKSQVKIYYFDSAGTPHVVGGVKIDWEIKKRDLEAEFSKGTQRTYGEDRKETGSDADKHDVTLKISNIAPNKGANPALTITVTDKNGNSTVFTFNGTSMSPTTNNGITIVGAGITNACENKWDASDSLYNVTEPSEKQTYEFSCAIDFLNAAEYTITVSLPTTSAALYNVTKDTSTTFSVAPKKLTISGNGTDSVTFDNKTHDYGWTVDGLVTKSGYGDTIAVLAAFSPKACAEIKDDTTSYEANLYSSDTALVTKDISLGTLAGVSLKVNENPPSIDLTGARKAGSYYLTFATLTAGNYTLDLVGGTKNENKSKKLAISTNTLEFNWKTDDTSGKHTYDKKTVGVITLTIKAKNGAIENFADFVNKYFTMSMTGKSGYKDPVISVSTDNQTATVTFTTGVNADTYKANVALNKNESAFIEENKGSCAYPTLLPQSKSYEILRRSLSFEFSTSNGTYNTESQGWNGVRAKAATSGSNTGLISDDSVKVGIVITRNGSSFNQAPNVSVSTSYVLGGLSTTAAGKYVATVTFDANNSANSNYTASAATASWEISKKILTLKGLTSGTRIYDGTAVTPTLSINDTSTTNGQFVWRDDVISVTYSVLDAQNNSHESLVNVGTYTITIGGTNAISVSPATRDNISTTENYAVDTSDSGSATYTIEPRQIKLSWESYESFVFSNAAQGLKINGVESVSEGGNGQLAVSSSTVTEARIKGYAGNDVIVITVSGAATHVAEGKKSMTAVISSVTGKNADGSDSILKNYEIAGGDTSDEFEITPSVVSIAFTATSETLVKVYDGNNTVPKDKILDDYFKLSATGHVPTSNPFTISGTYDNEKVVYDSKNNVIGGKAVTFSYTFTDSSGNYVAGTVDEKPYEVGDATVGGKTYNVGKITPKHIQVFLDKLRSNRATRTYTDDTTYGGNGVSGNGTTTPYRAGEGFSVKGVLTGDIVSIKANYAESDESRNTSVNGGIDFAKYVNDVYRDANGTFMKASSGKYLKKLVFEMNGADAGNYTFNVYHSANGAYSESDGNYVTKVTVYDYRENDQKRQNKSGSPQIQIEITVKSVKVEYSNAAQSYANDDNTYNTNWLPVTGVNKETDNAGADIIVTNGWMYSDGIDHSNESGYAKREYHGYTTIQGREGSSRLGASVSTKDGMNLNYRLSNQPILTIAYFVSESGEYKISSLAQLIIASFYYTAHQNQQNLDIIKIVSSDYDWVKVVSVGEDGAYVGTYKKPDKSPITDSKATTWDEYLAELQAAGYAVFFNTEKKEQGELGVWGYYSPKELSTYAIPTKFVQTKDITGTFTEQDIEILNAFFTTLSTDDDGNVTEKKYNWNGTNKEFLTNVLKARAGANVTINGSLFVSTATTKVDENDVLTGFDGSYDGNGYVIEYLNIMGYGKTNVGLFDIIGASGIVKNVHLRNVTINANSGNVGVLAGSVYESNTTETSIKNVSAHGAINVSGGTVGGLFGTSARDIENAIVLGTITSQNATVGGVVGTTSASVNNVVSLVQITANGGSVNPFTTSSVTIEDSYHMANAVWQKGSTFVNVSGNSKTFNELMSGSISGYGTENKYYYAGESAPTKGTFDVLDDVQLTALSATGAQNVANERQSMRLKDIVSVYLMMYSLSKTTGTLTSESNTFSVNVYALGSSSWLVGTADGTQSNPIAIANKQNVSLLRQLPFATFTLKKNIAIDITSTFAGAFFGTVESAKNTDGTSLGYKITCNKDMFEAYAESNSSWLAT